MKTETVIRTIAGYNIPVAAMFWQSKFINSIHKPPAEFKSRSIICVLPGTVESFQFSSRQVGVAYELS